MVLLTGVLAVAMAYIHTLGGRLQFLHVVPRCTWLSIAGGVSVAYVFVYILPRLARSQELVNLAGILKMRYMESHIYVLALIGLTAFYGLERAAKSARNRNRQAGQGDHAGQTVFWLHMSSFAIYNFLIGYLLVHREAPGMFGLALFFVAMSMHLLVNDFALWTDHKDAYRDRGRWILASAVLAGWTVGIITGIHELVLAGLFSFLSGGVLLNVMREELPEDRDSRFWAFALGAGVYTIVILTL